ncbi:DUF7828 domain-containing protein [Serratia sp. CY74737]|uniref:DUF7828 domain-containing protein n=1 Tax=Serratia sp. CY74737 TaxID=3383677 RepID=UPI003F9FF621
MAPRSLSFVRQIFLALEGTGQMTGTRTAGNTPYNRYTCNLCCNKRRYHPKYGTQRPWIEYTHSNPTEN